MRAEILETLFFAAIIAICLFGIFGCGHISSNQGRVGEGWRDPVPVQTPVPEPLWPVAEPERMPA